MSTFYPCPACGANSDVWTALGQAEVAEVSVGSLGKESQAQVPSLTLEDQAVSQSIFQFLLFLPIGHCPDIRLSWEFREMQNSKNKVQCEPLFP